MSDRRGLVARFKAAAGAFRQPGAGTGGSHWTEMILLPGSKQDWEEQAGNAWQNSAASIAIDWIAQSFQEARFSVLRTAANGAAEYDQDHPAAVLVRRPNAHYGGRTLLSASVLSLLCDGNAYWMRVRDGNGVATRELWYVPHWMVEPKWDETGAEYITHYEYSPGRGGAITLFPDDVVHLRYGIDPENTRKGMAPLKAQLRMVSADNEANTYMAVVLQNMGVVGMIVSNADPNVEMDDGAADTLKRLIIKRTTGDERGKPVVVPSALKVDRLGLNPEELALDKMASLPVGRICGALHVDPMAVGLPSDQRTYSNFAEAKRAAWENAVLPLMGSMCDDLDAQLLPEYAPRNGERCAFDTRGVLALQESEGERHDRARRNYAAGVWRRSEARVYTGLEADAADEVYMTDVRAAMMAAGGGTEGTPGTGRDGGDGKGAGRDWHGGPSHMEPHPTKAAREDPDDWAARVTRELEALHAASA